VCGTHLERSVVATLTLTEIRHMAEYVFCVDSYIWFIRLPNYFLRYKIRVHKIYIYIQFTGTDVECVYWTGRVLVKTWTVVSRAFVESVRLWGWLGSAGRWSQRRAVFPSDMALCKDLVCSSFNVVRP